LFEKVRRKGRRTKKRGTRRTDKLSNNDELPPNGTEKNGEDVIPTSGRYLGGERPKDNTDRNRRRPQTVEQKQQEIPRKKSLCHHHSGGFKVGGLQGRSNRV